MWSSNKYSEKVKVHRSHSPSTFSISDAPDTHSLRLSQICSGRRDNSPSRFMCTYLRRSSLSVEHMVAKPTQPDSSWSWSIRIIGEKGKTRVAGVRSNPAHSGSGALRLDAKAVEDGWCQKGSPESRDQEVPGGRDVNDQTRPGVKGPSQVFR